MADYIKGNAVANATSYELAEKKSGSYTKLSEAAEINFEVSALGLAKGDHVLAVKAKADGYADSAWSNEVTYTAKGSGLVIDIEEGSLGSDSGNEVTYTSVWRTVDYIDIAKLTNTISVVGSNFIISCYTSAQKYLGQYATAGGSLIKNAGQWHTDGEVIKTADILAADSTVGCVRLVVKANTPQILVNGEDCFGELVS